MLFCHLFSLTRICLCLDCINSCPLCLALNSCCIGSFPSYFQHLFYVIGCFSCLCSTQSASSGCWVWRCRLPGFSDKQRFLLISSYNQCEPLSKVCGVIFSMLWSNIVTFCCPGLSLSPSIHRYVSPVLCSKGNMWCWHLLYMSSSWPRIKMGYK